MSLHQTHRPVIGILLDYEASGSFSSRPYHALRTGYFDAIWKAGGLPVAIPYLFDGVEPYLSHIDALITPGGSFPYPDHWYDGPNNASSPSISSTDYPRLAFETEFVSRVLGLNMPLLGICAGMQIMAGVKGATFYRDVMAETDTTIDHLNERPAEQTAHDITITSGSLLARITGQQTMAVNTAHREAIRTVPEGVNVTAVAPDGVIEAIELPGYKFAIGVEWHPEFFLGKDDPNHAIITALVNAPLKE